jgi:uncharacterized membrane protein
MSNDRSVGRGRGADPRLSARTVHWVAEFGGSRHERDAEITEQKPHERVAWRNTDGRKNAGAVTFHGLDEARTRGMVQLDFVPEGVQEKLGDAARSPRSPGSSQTSGASRSSSSRAAPRTGDGAER